MKKILLGLSLLISTSAFSGEVFIGHNLVKSDGSWTTADSVIQEKADNEALIKCELKYIKCTTQEQSLKWKTDGPGWASSAVTIVYGEEKIQEIILNH